MDRTGDYEVRERQEDHFHVNPALRLLAEDLNGRKIAKMWYYLYTLKERVFKYYNPFNHILYFDYRIIPVLSPSCESSPCVDTQSKGKQT